MDGGKYMRIGLRKIATIMAPVLLSTSFYVPTVQAAQDGVYGPWYSTKCKDLPIDSPLGGRDISSPQIYVPGKELAQVCLWERKKNDCPKLSSKVKNPVKCFFRYQKSGWSANRPND